MYLYENPEQASASPFFQPPFVPITQIGHLGRVLPWIQYPHFHKDEYEISYMVQGQGTLNLPGTVLPLKKESIVIVPPNVAHCYVRVSNEDLDMEYYVIRFRAAANCAQPQNYLQSLQTAAVAHTDGIHIIQKLLDLILSEAADNRISEFAQVLGLSILQKTAVEFRRGGRPIDTYTPIYANDILSYLQQNVHRKVTMEEVSQEFNLSQSHIFRVFTKTYHTSPINYLIYCRMREARTYILNQNMPSEEIAKRLAYKNVYHFINTFQNFYGCHPDDYRKAAVLWEQ